MKHVQKYMLDDSDILQYSNKKYFFFVAKIENRFERLIRVDKKFKKNKTRPDGADAIRRTGIGRISAENKMVDQTPEEKKKNKFDLIL